MGKIDFKDKILHIPYGLFRLSIKCGKGSYVLGKSIIRKHRGSITFGERVRILSYARIQCVGDEASIVIGDNNIIGYRFSVLCKEHVSIGNNNFIASDVFICDYNHCIDKSKHYNHLVSAPVSIGSGCWIGEKTIILPGVTIGDGSIVGAGSVVTKSIPDNSIAVGNPAKVIKKWDIENKKWVTVK